MILFGLVFALFSAELVWFAFSIPTIGWVCLWPALSFGLVSLGHLGLGPKVMGKTSKGVPHPFFAILHLPFSFVGWLSGLLQTVLRRKEDAFNLVAPGLWLGRRLNNADKLPKSVRAIVDLTSEHSRIKNSDSYQYYVLPLLDGTAPKLSAFEHLLESLRDAPEDLYIHCWAGRGRSATTLAGILIERGLAGSVEEAIELMQAKRPQVRLSDAQHTLLNTWFEKHTPTRTPRLDETSGQDLIPGV